MSKKNVIGIFDVGKTNKKLFLFDEQYNILSEESTKLKETTDEDGFGCEDVHALSKWIKEKFEEIATAATYNLLAVNFSAYGASLVHIDVSSRPITPLYSYLKPYPENLKKKFYDTYGGEALISRETASPVLDSLNSGLQLYRLKYEQPAKFSALKYSLHLPQYISFLISSSKASDITSIGCHTQLWNFNQNDYHRWVYAEKLHYKFPPIFKPGKTVSVIAGKKKIAVGIGLHDSSAALIPYLKLFPEPFILLSTGTWCISLNPFNNASLTDYELENDCLCYLTYEGKPVKASRLFAGHEHEEQIKKLAEYYNKDVNYYTTITYNHSYIKELYEKELPAKNKRNTAMVEQSGFEKRPLGDFKTYEQAYHQLIMDIISQQCLSTQLVLKGTGVKRIFVDGGFSRNSVYMNLLASKFPDIEVFAASVAQATAVGAALSIHNVWNKMSLPNEIIELKYFSSLQNLV